MVARVAAGGAGGGYLGIALHSAEGQAPRDRQQSREREREESGINRKTALALDAPSDSHVESTRSRTIQQDIANS